VRIAISEDFLLAFTNIQRSHQKKVREFIERFREDPTANGINYEVIQSAKDKNLNSVRIDQAYRAVVFHPPGSDLYLLAWVDSHDNAYSWAEKRVFKVNPATGALQVLNVETVTEAAETPPPPRKKSFLAEIKDKSLIRFGVPEELIPLIRAVDDEKGVESLSQKLPQEAYEGVYLLAAGYSEEEVVREMERPAAPVAIDEADFAAALENEDSKRRFYVVEGAVELADILNAPLEQWRVFLHPKQRKLVTMDVNGPVRVLGGAGTGKTVAAMHRAKHLAEEKFNGKQDRILFTTFTRNLATDIQENLRKICSPEAMSRIEVINLDAWVANYLKARGYKSDVIFDVENNDTWRDALNEKPVELALSDEFYRSEWEEVIQAQNITSLDEYRKAPRIGRGTRLSRSQRELVWRVFQDYRAELNRKGAKELIDLIRDARELIVNRGEILGYRVVIVDETQDMSMEALRLIRAMVPPDRNDIFVVGDAHQRIYRRKASLGKCGIDIRGRGRKLKINYRTTAEIRRFATALLEGRAIDDLDSGEDSQKGYMSLTHGESPLVKSFGSAAEESKFIVSRIQALLSEGSSDRSICVGARTNAIMLQVKVDLSAAGLAVHQISRNADRGDKAGVRVATLHRIKGLEFDHVFVAAANDNVIPLAAAIKGAEDEVAARDVETSERALLYVGLTRAKKSATVTAYGTLTPFLREK
jgi:superfamily I DNA/RNA helicase